MRRRTIRHVVRPVTAITVALLGVVSTSSPSPGLRAQSPLPAEGQLRFEVASVKPNPKSFSEHFLGGSKRLR